MKGYEIVFARSARKDLDRIEPKTVQRILNKIGMLSDNPRPHGCEKLKGSEGLWRIRIGDYRVIYEIIDYKKMIDVSVIRHRREAYK